MSQKIRTLLLVTGNVQIPLPKANKLKQFKQILGPKYQLVAQNVDLEEMQGTPEQIATRKALKAFKMFRRPVLVQDTSLCFNAYKGLPGQFIKWFVQALGPEGLAKMTDPFEDKTGYALCTIGYMSPNIDSPLLFMGKCHGKIVPPRGQYNFGWDQIFQPNGSPYTYAQMTKYQKNKLSHRFLAIQSMKKHFESHLSD